ncbi:hypothetical protein [Aliiglaciecola litoralis]|uniref:Uncharacterized protein n=1 Tax=Aliiglaciecola litoralis TaxID=582857 RepID=A0ABN1LDI1_9ALTE
MQLSQHFSRSLLVVGLVFIIAVTILISGCANQPQYSQAQLDKIAAHDALIEEAQQFVHANLFTGMIHVWSVDRQPWNALLGVYLCGSTHDTSAIISSYEANQPIFSEAMKFLASNEGRFGEANQQAVLDDVAKVAYRLFSASYGQGYARQVKLADILSPGIHDELCGGRIIESDNQGVTYPSDMKWSSFNDVVLARNNGLKAHAQNGYQAFQVLLQQQYAQFDALVYSHAYQQSEAYEALFFEVNKIENVEQYGSQVETMATMTANPGPTGSNSKQNEFAYLVLSTGYHWGMMSVLAMLEEEYPRLHDSKRQQAASHIAAVIEKLQIAQSEQ